MKCIFLQQCWIYVIHLMETIDPAGACPLQQVKVTLALTLGIVWNNPIYVLSQDIDLHNVRDHWL